MAKRSAVVIAGLIVAIFPRSGLADEPVSWATAQAIELDRQAREHAGRGEIDTATHRFLDALKLDPTYGAAYLGLGALQEAAGDPREAERTYATGLDHVSGFREAYRARARLRARQRRFGEALADLEAAVTLQSDDISALKELASGYVSVGALPAALGITRRIAVLAEVAGETRVAGEARTSARALSLLVGAVDPVAAGANGRGVVRQALARFARRR